MNIQSMAKQMNDVERWADTYEGMIHRRDGDYVLYTDYASLQSELAAAREALQAAEADVALLNAGCIITTDRDELGNDELVFRSGMNLRSAISEAAEYQRRSDATLQRDRQP